MARRSYVVVVVLILAVALIFSILYINPSFNNSQKQNSRLQEANMSISFTGDVMLGPRVGTALAAGQNVFADLKPMFEKSDLVVVNLEAPFTNSNQNWKQVIPFKANPQFAHYLKDNSIDVATLANNHIMDYGPTGLHDTITALKENNVSYVGAGENIDEASQPFYYKVNNVTIAILSFYDNTTFPFDPTTQVQAATDSRPGYAPMNWDLIKKSIATARNNSDLVVVCFHYGVEYSLWHDERQEEFSRKSIDEGADLIIGNHPHVTQEIEMYKGKLIFYSLGNTVFYDLTAGSPNNIIVEYKVTNGTAQAIIHPILVYNYAPHIMDDQSANVFLKSIKDKSNINMTIENGLGIIDIGKL